MLIHYLFVLYHNREVIRIFGDAGVRPHLHWMPRSRMRKKRAFVSSPVATISKITATTSLMSFRSSPIINSFLSSRVTKIISPGIKERQAKELNFAGWKRFATRGGYPWWSQKSASEV